MPTAPFHTASAKEVRACLRRHPPFTLLPTSTTRHSTHYYCAHLHASLLRSLCMSFAKWVKLSSRRRHRHRRTSPQRTTRYTVRRSCNAGIWPVVIEFWGVVGVVVVVLRQRFCAYYLVDALRWLRGRQRRRRRAHANTAALKLCAICFSTIFASQPASRRPENPAAAANQPAMQTKTHCCAASAFARSQRDNGDGDGDVT